MNPLPEPIASEVERILSTKLLADVESVHTDLLETGALDSVRLVELLMHLEQSFGLNIELATLEIEDFRTIASIARLVARLQRGENGEPG